ncbi:MAG TPA: hypothetical protein ENH94_09075 [Phycisphaerales bacterium]|nr:hypothetical protein [Phycisphaerales bacterium]
MAGVAITVILGLSVLIWGLVSGWLKSAIVGFWIFLFSDVTTKGWALVTLFFVPFFVVAIWNFIKAKFGNLKEQDAEFPKKDEVFGIIWEYSIFESEPIVPLCPRCEHELEFFLRGNAGGVNFEYLYVCHNKNCNYFHEADQNNTLYTRRVEGELTRRTRTGENSTSQAKKRISTVKKKLKTWDFKKRIEELKAKSTSRDN